MADLCSSNCDVDYRWVVESLFNENPFRLASTLAPRTTYKCVFSSPEKGAKVHVESGHLVVIGPFPNSLACRARQARPTRGPLA